MAQKTNLLFDCLSNIVYHKSIDIYRNHINDDLNFKTISKFMVLRYLTMSTNSNIRDMVIDNYITLERMSEKILYRWLLTNIPRQSSSFIKYIK